MNSTAIKRAAITVGFTALAGMAATLGALVATGSTAHAAAPALDKKVAYVRAGVIYVSDGASEVRLTEDEVNSRPRFSPDGERIAYLHNGTVWVMGADGAGKRQVSDRTAGGPSWSPDGKRIAYSALSCTGGPGVFSVSSTTAGAASVPLFPSSCRDQAVPEVGFAMGAPTTGPANGAGKNLTDRLRTDDAVAWSPDGKKIAFRGGDCESIADACLSVGNLATGGEVAIDVYGGGGNGESGFGVVPAWSPDSRKVSWTAYTTNGSPLHLKEADANGANLRKVGKAQDREMVYLNTGEGVLTANHKGSSWITVVDLSTGARTPLHQGSQPTVQA